jgi:hypothetical protein
MPADGSQADDDDLDALSFAPEAGPSQPPKPAPAVSGRIGAPSGSSTTWGGVRVERRYTGQSTLDEPVSATIVSPQSERKRRVRGCGGKVGC